jgi:conjugal transfer pilus assembly protein TraF
MRKSGEWLFLCFFYFLSEQSGAAVDSFFDLHRQGWHWYEEKPEEKSEKNTAHQKPVSATAQIKQLQAQVEEQLNRAVLHPTVENVMSYIQLQNQLTQQASLFSHIWQSVLLSNPTMDYRLEHPTNQFAQHVYRENQRHHNQQAIQTLAKSYGLFFFITSSCPYCHAFAPTVKTLAQRYGLSVLVVSLDGKGTPDYPQALPNNGVAERLGVKGVPALFAVRSDKGKAYPLTFGLISAAELEERLAQLAEAVKERP